MSAKLYRCIGSKQFGTPASAFNIAYVTVCMSVTFSFLLVLCTFLLSTFQHYHTSLLVFIFTAFFHLPD